MNADIEAKIIAGEGKGETDELGNPIVEVEASNENLDLENQKILQDALMNSKDDFLKRGIVSYEHLFKERVKDDNGEPIRTVANPEYIIGEPVDVRTEGNRTIAKVKLYKNNAFAKDIVSKLKDGCTRIRASIGAIAPVKEMRNGVECITSLLWNDLALTPVPVNNTVGAAVLKSLNGKDVCELLQKAMTAGNETDATKKQGGGALLKEDVGGAMKKAKSKDDELDEKELDDDDMDNDTEDEQDDDDDDDYNDDDFLDECKKDLLAMQKKGRVKTKSAACEYLCNKGLTKKEADTLVDGLNAEDELEKSLALDNEPIQKSGVTWETIEKSFKDDKADVDDNLQETAELLAKVALNNNITGGQVFTVKDLVRENKEETLTKSEAINRLIIRGGFGRDFAVAVVDKLNELT